jgi:hypothetical protein
MVNINLLLSDREVGIVLKALKEKRNSYLNDRGFQDYKKIRGLENLIELIKLQREEQHIETTHNPL